MTYRLGLTGGIGMGKSTTARMFHDRGVPVWDADAAVHRLYAAGGAAVTPVATAFPTALRDGAIDRAALKLVLVDDPAALRRLEALVHPLVAQDRSAFLAAQTGTLAVFDIPLLFEAGLESQMDGTAVVTTDAKGQRARVLARPGMTLAALQIILDRQMSDDEKRARADWIIPTDSLKAAQAAVARIIQEVTSDA